MNGPYRDGPRYGFAVIGGLFLLGALIAPDDLPVAQRTEQARPKREVGGSIPSGQAMTFQYSTYDIRLKGVSLPDRVIRVTATAYSSSPDETDSTPNVGAFGPVGPGTVAVSRDLLRYVRPHQRVKVNGRSYIVRDTMHQRWRRRVDLWKPSKQQAIQYGVREAWLELE